MSEMVERVARAIARHHYGSDGYRDEDDGVQYWELCVPEARAAIEAANVWQAMTDAALSESDNPGSGKCQPL